VRSSESDGLLEEANLAPIARKPKGHDFVIDRRRGRVSVPRHMSVTGG
jgi:cyclic pyranopterin phosphate synthase